MIMLDDLCASLLPPDDHITFQSLIIDAPRLILVAAMISINATCPDCRQPTRRFRCPPCTCRRQTFAERLPSVAPLYRV